LRSSRIDVGHHHVGLEDLAAREPDAGDRGAPHEDLHDIGARPEHRPVLRGALDQRIAKRAAPTARIERAVEVVIEDAEPGKCHQPGRR
jgi:hypothetical protein